MPLLLLRGLFIRLCSTKACEFSILSIIASSSLSSIFVPVKKVLSFSGPPGSNFYGASLSIMNGGSVVLISGSFYILEIATLSNLFFLLASKAYLWKNSFSSTSFLCFSFHSLTSLLRKSSLFSLSIESCLNLSIVSSKSLILFSLKFLSSFLS